MLLCARSILGNEMLAIQKLTAGYGKLTVLHEVSLEIPTGQFTAILGPNGSGKSTLLRSVFGLTDISDGSIQFGGRELVGMAVEAIARLGIAYVPQRSNVFTALTVRENLQLAARQMSKDDSTQAQESAYELFPILQKRFGQRAGQLSGGERQMLAIALGWLARPRLMLLDEPTAGLAPLFVKEVFRTLKQLVEQGITLVVVEQNARSALQWCDYVFVLREGQVVFHNPTAATLGDEEALKGFLGVGRSLSSSI